MHSAAAPRRHRTAGPHGPRGSAQLEIAPLEPRADTHTRTSSQNTRRNAYPLHDIDPYVYLVEVLQRVDTHPFERVEELTPRLWKHHFADNPMRSMLDPGRPD